MTDGISLELEARLKKGYSGHIYLDEDGGIRHGRISTSHTFNTSTILLDHLPTSLRTVLLPRSWMMNQGELLWGAKDDYLQIITLKTKKFSGRGDVFKLIQAAEDVATLQGKSYIRGKIFEVPERLANRYGWEAIRKQYDGIMYRKNLVPS